jgi:urease accessory protein
MKSSLQIQAGLRNGRTILQDCFHAQPFKIMNISGHSKDLHLMLMSASPGLLEGDEHHLEIRVLEGAALCLETQAYQRFFAMEEGATQQLDVHLEQQASFSFLPHPAVPHAGARVHCINNFHLAKRSSLLWGEVLTCGRKGSGERFRFTSYRSRTQVWYDSRLLFREVISMEPATMDLDARGLYEGYSHQANLLCIDERIPPATLLDTLQPMLNDAEGLLCGISALPAAGVLIRMLGQGAEQLYEHLQSLAVAFRELQKGTIPSSKIDAYAG